MNNYYCSPNYSPDLKIFGFRKFVDAFRFVELTWTVLVQSPKLKLFCATNTYIQYKKRVELCDSWSEVECNFVEKQKRSQIGKDLF